MKTILKNLFLPALIITAGVLLFPSFSRAATSGTDTASNSAYSGGWITGTGGGAPGFGPWTLSTSNTTGDVSAASGFFIASSTGDPGNGAGTGNIDTSGSSFGIFAHFGSGTDTGNISANANRSFDSALTVGQTFSIQIGVNFRNGNKGIDILDASNVNLFNLNVGSDTYTVNNVTTGGGSLFGNAYDATSIFTISLTQTSAGGGTWIVVRTGSSVGTGTATGSYTGDPAKIGLYNSNTDPNSLNANNLYFNNLKIVPEPASYAMAFAGFGILFGIRRFRKSSMISKKM